MCCVSGSSTGRSVLSVEAIQRGALRMNVMIQDLVDAARQEGGQLTLQRQPVNLRAYLENLLQRSATSMAVGRLRIDLPDDLPARFRGLQPAGAHLHQSVLQRA